MAPADIVINSPGQERYLLERGTAQDFLSINNDFCFHSLWYHIRHTELGSPTPPFIYRRYMRLSMADIPYTSIIEEILSGLPILQRLETQKGS